VTYRVEVQGRDGLISLPTWTPAPSWITGRDEMASTLFTLKEATAFARDCVAGRCTFAIRIVDEDGSAFFYREHLAAAPLRREPSGRERPAESIDGRRGSV
jgi:hypothetical protein